MSGDVFLDLKKAFDLVDHRILLSKLSVYLNSSNSLPFFCSYLKNRVQRVFICGSYSSEGTVKYGVPQRSVLGPVLFCIYINELPLYIPSNSAECHMFADDTTLHTTGKSVVQIQKTLQLCLDRISGLVNHMLINPVKTKSMIITTRQKNQLSTLSLDGQNIENVTEHRLLGLIVDNKFRWQAHTEHICKSMSKKKKKKKKKRFLLSQLQHIRNIDTKKNLLQRSHKISHRLCVNSVVWLWRGTLKKQKLNSLHRRAGKLIIPDPSVSTEQR